KVLASTDGKKLSRKDAEQATGAPRHALVHELAQALSEGDTEKALMTIRTGAEHGIEMPLFLALLLEYVRTVLLMRHAPELRKELEAELGEDMAAEAGSLAAGTDSKLTHETLAALLEASARMRFTPVPELPLELAVLALSGE